MDVIEISALLGLRGMKVMLEKISKKEGKKSGTRVGNQKYFLLSGPIKTGYQICAVRENETNDLRNEAKEIPVTSIVIGIKAQTKRVFEIETEKSFYLITFL